MPAGAGDKRGSDRSWPVAAAASERGPCSSASNPGPCPEEESSAEWSTASGETGPGSCTAGKASDRPTEPLTWVAWTSASGRTWPGGKWAAGLGRRGARQVVTAASCRAKNVKTEHQITSNYDIFELRNQQSSPTKLGYCNRSPSP